MLINNKLARFKNFLEKCDILFTPVIFCENNLIRGIESYIFKVNKIYGPKSPEIRKIPIKSTVIFLSADKKSTMNFRKTPETRYQLTSLILNPKKINIDQL